MFGAPPIGTMEMPSASRFRPRRSASASSASWSLIPSTSTTVCAKELLTPDSLATARRAARLLASPDRTTLPCRQVAAVRPFADRTGGLITFETDEPGEAEAAVDEDPFVKEALLEAYWMKEWVPE